MDTIPSCATEVVKYVFFLPSNPFLHHTITPLIPLTQTAWFKAAHKQGTRFLSPLCTPP